MQPTPAPVIPLPIHVETSTPPEGRQPRSSEETLIIAAADADLSNYHLAAFHRMTVRSTAELAALMAREHPTAVAIDADLPGFDAAAACAAVRLQENVAVLVALSRPEQAPVLLKNGCHAVLMKPFARNLFASRMGRVLRDRAQRTRWSYVPRNGSTIRGTNRAWETVECPRCREPNAVSFDFASHRRMWFACLSCNQVWIGQRQE